MFDLLPPADQLRAAREWGDEGGARAQVARVWQEASHQSARAAQREHAWLQGGHSVCALETERRGLLAAAAAAAAAGDADLARTLCLVDELLHSTLVPAAELCAGMKVDMASNNG